MSEDLDLLVKEIADKGIISAFTRIGKVFYDEPSMYFFTANLGNRSPYYEKKGYVLHDHLSACGGAGVSFDSEQMAVLKCLSEAVERFSGMIYRENNIAYFPYAKKLGNAINPGDFGADADEAVFGWVKGVELAENKTCYIPAQLAYLMELPNREPQLTVRNSTGTASGFSFDATLLRGLYEIVERDCFMTAFYNKIPLPKVSEESIKDEAIRHLFALCRRYRLGLSVHEMTHDLGVPAYLALLTDETGMGPAITAGMKAGFNIYDTIRDSIQESFISRFKMRYEVYAHKKRNFAVVPEDIHDHVARGFYWYPVSRLKEIVWLLEQPGKPLGPVAQPVPVKAQLSRLQKAFAGMGLKAYYYDLTLSNFRKIPFYTLKTFVPGLQPLHIDEDDKLLVGKRLGEVARFFGTEPAMNQSPHFF